MTELDLSHFDTRNVTDMGYMFDNCSSLQTIYASESFTTDGVIENAWRYADDHPQLLFGYCSALVGGNGKTQIDKDISVYYACIDTSETPGYFTSIAASPTGGYAAWAAAKGLTGAPERVTGD